MNYNPKIIKEIEFGSFFLGAYADKKGDGQKENSDADLTKKQEKPRIDEKYHIQQWLINKFTKRNIGFNDTALYEMSIDSIKFKAFDEEVSVLMTDCPNETAHEEYFRFYLYGSLKQDEETLFTVSDSIYHNTNPRESILLPCTMAEDGIAAEPKIMIENTIHKFSYLFYKKLKEFDIVIGESKRVD